MNPPPPPMAAVAPATELGSHAAGSDAFDWKATVAPYVGGDTWRSVWQLTNTSVLLVLSWLASVWLYERSVVLGILMMFPTAGMLTRMFIIMHDCTHGSFFPSRRAMEIVGYIAGVLTFTPFDQWRRDHALHHATSGDLDRRGHGDIDTWTVREYLAKTPRQQRWYRITRNPFALLIVGPLYLIFGHRFRRKSVATRDRQQRTMLTTNLGIVAIAIPIVLWKGWAAYFLYAGSFYWAGVLGIWLFYVQHQFEDAYWESHTKWDYATAALRGSSYLKLPKFLQWISGNIGLHHVHHLAPKIPNYRLQACHDENPALQIAPVITIRTAMRTLRLGLWDEDQKRLIRFDELKHH